MLNGRKKTGRRAYRSSLLAALALILGFVMINTGIKADAAKAKFVKKAGRTYYYDAKGRKATGLKKIKGKWYYFSKKGVRYQKGWQTIKGKKYYFSKKNGAAYTGLKKISGKLYLFAKDGKRYGSGLITYSGKTYYVKGGNVQTGWRNLKGNRYYFSDRNGAALTGWQTVAGKEYCFDDRGGMQKGKWIGDKYVGAKGYVTKEKGEEEGQTPGFQFPEKPEPVVEEQPFELFYNETYSDQIFKEINLVREHYGLEPLKKATGTLLTQSILRASYNIVERESIGEMTGEGPIDALARHGAGQIGTGTNGGPEYFMEPTYNAKIDKVVSGAVDSWINSDKGHLNNLLTQHADYMAVAVMYSNVDSWGWGPVSAIVTFGGAQTEHYFIDGVDMGIYEYDTAPLYGYSVRLGDGYFDVSKEYVANTVLEVPYEKWDEYLSNYKTIR